MKTKKELCDCSGIKQVYLEVFASLIMRIEIYVVKYVILLYTVTLFFITNNF